MEVLWFLDFFTFSPFFFFLFKLFLKTKKIVRYSLSFSFVKFLKAQLKRKIRTKSKWHVDNTVKRRKLSHAKYNQIRSDTEESQHTSTEHTELGNTEESSVEENEKQNASESNIDLKNNSSISNIENELEEANQTTECTELRKDKIDCNRDASSSQIIEIPDENESKGKSLLKW